MKKRQVVKGIPQEIVDRLMRVGGCTGHAEMLSEYDYDSACTAIETELYKLVTMDMLHEAGVKVWVNTFLAGAIRSGSRLTGVIAESRSGREAIYAKAFVNPTGYGDLVVTPEPNSPSLTIIPWPIAWASAMWISSGCANS